MPVQVTREAWQDIFSRAPQAVIDGFVSKQYVLDAAGITETRQRLAYFTANIEHKCGGFTIPNLTENINYTAERMAQVWPNRFKMLRQFEPSTAQLRLQWAPLLVPSDARSDLQHSGCTTSWSYSTATPRAANGSSTIRTTFIRGMDEDLVSSSYSVAGNMNSATSNIAFAGVGLDTTSGFTGMVGSNQPLGTSVQYRVPIVGSWSGMPGVGLHYISAIENVTGDTAIYIGLSNGVNQSGLSVTISY